MNIEIKMVFLNAVCLRQFLNPKDKDSNSNSNSSKVKVDLGQHTAVVVVACRIKLV